MSPAREAFLAVCSELGSELAVTGMRFRRSIPDLRVRRGEWTCGIVLTSARYNTADDVCIEAYVSIESDRLAQYRAATSPRDDKRRGYLLGGLLSGGFFPNSVDVPTELGAPSSLDAPGPAVRRLAELIGVGPLAMLSAAEDPNTALDHIPDHLVLRQPECWIDYLGAYDQQALVPSLLDRCIFGGFGINGKVFTRRALLVDSRRQLAGLPLITDQSPDVVHAFVAALQRVGAVGVLDRLGLD